jgi:predicted DNA-binding transcriptional regulator YafY
MTTRRAGGIKRSSWLTFRRRLLLVRLLLRGPASASDLIDAVQAELGGDGYPAAAAAALKHDLDALKAEYGCRIIFQRETGCYILDDLGDLALLDLPDNMIEALAFLDASFPAGSAMPEQMGVRALLDRVLLLLPARRRDLHHIQRNAPSLNMPARSGRRIDAGVLATVKRAIDARQELVFRYWGIHDIDAPRRHRVAPYGIFFRPEGHGYLDATLLDASPPGGETIHAAIDYRLDRIVPGTIQLLPQLLPPERIQPRSFQLRYRLLPTVARRRDVASYFPDTQINYHEDGSATVSARVTNLWQARQVLLRYGPGCTVLAPVELIAMFRETSRGLAAIYGAE